MNAALMNRVLAAWNALPPAEATTQLLHCCATRRWAEAVVAHRPFENEFALVTTADNVWATMQEPDWMEAFRAHPRIGEKKVQASEQSQSWSRQEQGSVDHAEATIKQSMAEGNARYEELFGFTYIVCATGKTLPEMLTIMQTRLEHDRATELREAAEQQRQITQIRLRKWLNP
jgi:2-oxo-4-hydroxy-4-carboxy-5-ureidoimidazoline decarboxylase